MSRPERERALRAIRLSTNEFERRRARNAARNRVLFEHPQLRERERERIQRVRRLVWAFAAFVFLVCVIVLLESCTPERDIQDTAAIISARNAWLAVGLPMPRSSCIDDLRVVRELNSMAFAETCAAALRHDDPLRATSCITSVFSHAPWQAVVYTAHLAPDNTHVLSSIRHETLHVLLMCTGLAADGDVLHANAFVWEMSGGRDSAEARAWNL